MSGRIVKRDGRTNIAGRSKSLAVHGMRIRRSLITHRWLARHGAGHGTRLVGVVGIVVGVVGHCEETGQ